MIFDALETLPDDPVGQVYVALRNDANPDKLDLGIGVYRDDHGRSPIMASVRQAMTNLLEKQITKEYLSPVGNMRYCSVNERLVLGADHPALNAGRLLTVQTPGAGGGLRAGADMIKAASHSATVWVPAPTWSHQRLVFATAGVRMAEYPYYDVQANQLLFDEMIEALRKSKPGDAVLLHGCCHNPTGEDLSHDQWRAVAAMLAQTGAMPFVDLAYQGFGDGIEEDTFGVRLFAAEAPEMILAVSSSKSFGIYRDRAGTLSILCKNVADKKNTARHLSKVTRALYFMPPDAGAAIVVEVLEDEALEKAWRAELDGMRARIVALRKTFAAVLKRELDSSDFNYIIRQKGMFSLLPLTPEALTELRTQHGIYLMPDARINLAALTDANEQRVGSAIAAVIARQNNASAKSRARHARG